MAATVGLVMQTPHYPPNMRAPPCPDGMLNIAKFMEQVHLLPLLH
jgi:hypothetical protein